MALSRRQKVTIISLIFYWPAALLVVGTVIFGITNIARANLAEMVPVAYAIFHLFAYAIFTMLWIQYMHLYLSLKPPKPQWLVSALAGPTVLLTTVKLFSIALGKVLGLQEVIISVVALAAVVVTTCLMTLSHKTKDAKDIVQS